MVSGKEQLRQRYMLDANTVSYIIKGTPPLVRDRLSAVPMTKVCISAITQAELLLGVARKPGALRLRQTVREFLLRIDILPWDDNAAEAYAILRSESERNGLSLGSMDMLIAAHAVAVGAVLVTNDKAFNNAKHFVNLEDWTQPR